ncbi:tetratricopeptide repeat protein [Acidithiobacillus sulfuriphilus]|uniref:Sel1 repeat family protein n=2 Tax=Acidithiobacillus sulfuriphilus TaxID=1867749 RepID=A0A3M8R3U7_9PROT|nr:tetratricopeptide repeat protein [Acidithiobacillus sulfuriphilus]RNF63237.1 sel1 repeat family protein [Acidithiobacillus sulfuriphilus]
MKKPVILAATLLALVTVGPAYAAKQLDIAAYKGDPSDLAKLETSAIHGDIQAQFWLGAYYGSEGDRAKTIHWYRKAALQGEARAENIMGLAYYKGRGVPRNYFKAVRWYRKAAQQGDALAENNLGKAYYFGQGVPQDYAKAAYWFHKAAQQGLVNAEANLGDAYANGLGVPKNIPEAIYWWKKAAAQGGRVGKLAQQNINSYEHPGLTENSQAYQRD